MALYIFRHAATGFNNKDDERLRGWLEVPPTPEGLQHVRENSRYLKTLPIRQLYSSDLDRAAQTAQIIGHATGAKPVLTAALRPWNTGVLTGRPLHDVLPWLLHYEHNAETPVPGGESYATFYRRWSGALAHALEIARHVDRQTHGHVGIVTHSGNLNAVDHIVTGGREPVHGTNIVHPGDAMIVRFGPSGLTTEPLTFEEGDFQNGNKTRGPEDRSQS